LPSVVVDFAFLHSHGVMLLSLGASGTADRARERQPLTPNQETNNILAQFRDYRRVEPFFITKNPCLLFCGLDNRPEL
jgi:hypothetical protein